MWKILYSYDFNNEIIIQKYIYIWEDTNTCESLKQYIQWKNIPYTYYVLKIDRHIYTMIYTNLELKTNYSYKNKWKKNPRSCADRDLVLF